VYYDTWTHTCSPCQSGAVNYCQTVSPPAPGTGGGVDWIMEAARQGGAPLSAPISQCCETQIDEVTGELVTVCDTEMGCGWVSTNNLCAFTTEGGTYPTVQDCLATNPGSGMGPVGTHLDWFPPCEGGDTSQCYFDGINSCLPSVFGRQQGARVVSSPQGCTCNRG